MAAKRFYLIIFIFLALILSVPMLAMLDNEKKLVDDFEAAISSQALNLVYLGSASCPWCTKYNPVIADLAQEENFSYIYIDVDELSSDEERKLHNLLGVIRGGDPSFGLPLTLLVADNRLVAELNGYNETDDLRAFLAKNNFIANGEGQMPKPSDELSNESINEVKEALASSNKEIIFIGSKTCPACAQFAPVFDEVVAEYNLESVYVELSELAEEEYWQLVELVEFSGVPHILTAVEDEIIMETSGALNKEALVALLLEKDIIE